MQQPVRYYIVPTDNEPVVRTVPVTVRSDAEDAAAVERPEGRDDRADHRGRVARLMRTAIERAPRRHSRHVPRSR